MPYALARPEYKSLALLGTMPLLLHNWVVDQMTHAHVPVCHADMDASLTKRIVCCWRVACFRCPSGACWWI